MATEPQSSDSSATASSSATGTDPSSLYASFHDFPFNADPGFLSGLSNILGHPGVPPTDAELGQKPDLVLEAKCFYYNRMFRPPTAIDKAGYKRWLTTQEKGKAAEIPRSVPVTGLTETTTTTTEPQITPTPTPTLTNSSNQAQQPSSSGTEIDTTTTSTSTSPPPPPYPTSFAAIVDLITNNKPIPGIEEIPDTVLELGSSKRDTASRRRKPWEKEEDDDVDETGVDIGSLAIGAVGHRGDGEGQVGAGAGTDTGTGTAGEEGEEEAVSEMSRYRGKGDGVVRLLQPDAVPDGGLVASS